MPGRVGACLINEVGISKWHYDENNCFGMCSVSPMFEVPGSHSQG